MKAKSNDVLQDLMHTFYLVWKETQPQSKFVQRFEKRLGIERLVLKIGLLSDQTSIALTYQNSDGTENVVGLMDVELLNIHGRVQTIVGFVTKLKQLIPIGKCVLSYRKNGFSKNEILFESYGGKCVYCGAKIGPFNTDHVVPKSKGGPDKLSNLALSCVKCNTEKNDHLLEDWLKDQPQVLTAVKDKINGSSFYLGKISCFP